MRKFTTTICTALLIGLATGNAAAQTEGSLSGSTQRSGTNYRSVLGDSAYAPSRQPRLATAEVLPSPIFESSVEYAPESHINNIPPQRIATVPDFSRYAAPYDDCDFCQAPQVHGHHGAPVCGNGGGWAAGVDLVFLNARYSNNVAMSVTDVSGNNARSTSDLSFENDLTLSPRVWLGWGPADGMGWRVQWWRLDQDSNDLEAFAPNSGLGAISTPIFPEVDISVNLPGESMFASSSLKVWALDVEATRETMFHNNWSLMAAGGIRYAKIDQRTRLDSFTLNGTQLGYIDFENSIDGAGPTVFLEARRIMGPRFSIFANARGSLLYGTNDIVTTAGEDLNLASSHYTRRSSSSDNLLPNLETRIGFDYVRQIRCANIFYSAAFEGQWWGGVGSASSKDGDLGLVGFVIGAGIQY